MAEHIHELLIDTRVIDYSGPRGMPVSEIFVQCLADDCALFLSGNEIILYMAKIEKALDERLREEYNQEDHRLGGSGRTFDQFKIEVLK